MIFSSQLSRQYPHAANRKATSLGPVLIGVTHSGQK
jgi:hypothetical protein